jgi:hypothetical protein
MLKIINKKPEEAAKIKDIIKLRVEKPEDVENLILSNFNIMMNMRVEEDEKIDFEDEESFEEECPMEENYNFDRENIVNECYIEKNECCRGLKDDECFEEFSYIK